jgi:hypothetical protein
VWGEHDDQKEEDHLYKMWQAQGQGREQELNKKLCHCSTTNNKGAIHAIAPFLVFFGIYNHLNAKNILYSDEYTLLSAWQIIGSWRKH